MKGLRSAIALPGYFKPHGVECIQSVSVSRLLVGCAWLCRESVKESFRRCADCSDKGYCITIEMSFLRYQESVRDRDMW